MDRRVIPYDDEGATQLTQQRAEEVADVGRADVGRVQLEVEPAAPTGGTEGEARDGRHAVAAVPVSQGGRLSARGPKPADPRSQQETPICQDTTRGLLPGTVFF